MPVFFRYNLHGTKNPDPLLDQGYRWAGMD